MVIDRSFVVSKLRSILTILLGGTAKNKALFYLAAQGKKCLYSPAVMGLKRGWTPAKTACPYHAKGCSPRVCDAQILDDVGVCLHSCRGQSQRKPYINVKLYKLQDLVDALRVVDRACVSLGFACCYVMLKCATMLAEYHPRQVPFSPSPSGKLIMLHFFTELEITRIFVVVYIKA